jgi:hypothetical protein
VKFSGTFEEVKTAIESFSNNSKSTAANNGDSSSSNNSESKAWAELQIIEETVTPAIQSAVSNFVADFDSEEIEILNHRITSTSAPLGIIDMVDDQTHLEDLKPNMVLAKMMESESFTEEQRAMIMQAFIELQEMEEGEEDE